MKAPNFKLPSTSGIFQLSDYLGKNIILYFYPRDNTKGCTCLLYTSDAADD